MKARIIPGLLILFLISSNLTLAQNATTTQDDFSKFGVGVSFQPFSLASILEESNMIPVGGINMAVNIQTSFRLELDLAYLSRNDKTDDEKYSAFTGGIGLLYTKRKNSTVIMGGVKLDYTTGKSEFKGSFGNNPTTFENKISSLSIGPVLGYEYLFSRNFSMGGEVGFKVRNFKEEIDEDIGGEEDIEISSTYFHNAIFVRVYF